MRGNPTRKVLTMNPYAFANVPASSTDAYLVNAQPDHIIRVLAVFVLAGSTATSITFNSKPSGSAGVPISITIACAANGGMVLPENGNGWFATAKGEHLTVTTGSGSTVGVQLVYEIA